MKTNKIIFWTATGIVAGMMLMSSGMYLTHNPQITNGMKLLGYPPYRIYILGIAKLLGAIGLVQPLSARLREWAYAGLFITFIGAAWSHLATGTPFMAPLIFLAILGVSCWFNIKLKPESARNKFA
jgi:hypothetical protein